MHMYRQDTVILETAKERKLAGVQESRRGSTSRLRERPPSREGPPPSSYYLGSKYDSTYPFNPKSPITSVLLGIVFPKVFPRKDRRTSNLFALTPVCSVLIPLQFAIFVGGDDRSDVGKLLTWIIRVDQMLLN